MQIRFLILLLVAVLAVSCRKKAVDPGKPLCAVSDSVRQNYSESALQMILRHYYDNKEFLSGYSDGKFSKEQQEEILGYIQSVYDLDIPERDTVFDIHRVRALPLVELNSLYLYMEKEAPETKRLLAGGTTGNFEFDVLLGYYQIDSFYVSSDDKALGVVAISHLPLNTDRVVEELDDFPFVWYALSSFYSGDGDDIRITYSPSHVDLDFSIGRGDCPAGCTYRRHWIFRVTGCSAEFIRSYGG